MREEGESKRQQIITMEVLHKVYKSDAEIVIICLLQVKWILNMSCAFPYRFHTGKECKPMSNSKACSYLLYFVHREKP